jgi:soluble lytic murein transglycosylase-like protein
MQINLSAHGKKFKSIADAFDPAFNIEYSAKLLKSLYNRFGDWKKAVEYYHTANPRFHIPYGNRVYRIWYKMQDTSPEFFSRSENKNILNLVLDQEWV